MIVAYVRGNEPPKPKAPTRKEEVDRLAKRLIAKWSAHNRVKAMKKYNLTNSSFLCQQIAYK